MSSRFAALSQRDFRVLWFGGLFSFLGIQMQFFLRGILAWELTRRADALGLVFFVFGLALLTGTPLGGVASDRLPKRMVMLVGQVGIVSSAVGMGTVVLAGVVQFWMLLVASVIQGISFGFLGPARVAMATDLVGRENLGNALGLQSLAMNGTRVFAPSVAGALVGVPAFGIGPTYLVASAIAVLSLWLTAILPNPPPTIRDAPQNPLLDIADGIRYVRSHPDIRNIVLTTFAVLMFAFSYVSFIPALVEGEFGLGDQQVGFFASASSAGALAAGFWVAGIADSPHARAIMTVAGTLFGVMVIGLGLAPVFLIALVIAVIAGAGTTTFQTLSNTLALRSSKASYQGRVQSIMQLGFAGFGLMSLPLGVLAEQIGLRPTLILMGSVASIAVAIYGYSARVWGAAPVSS